MTWHHVVMIALAAMAAVTPAAKAAPAEGTLETGTIETKLVPSPVKFTVLLPPGYSSASLSLPLVLFLHGGAGDNGFLALLKPVIEKAWADGDIPPSVFVTPDADRSFYMDYRDGSQKWDSFIVSELIPYMRAHYHVSSERSKTVATGASMGGLGSLTLGFRHPEMFGGIAALEAGIEPGLSFYDLKPRNHIQRSDALFEERFGSPVDNAWFMQFNPANLAISNRDKIMSSNLQIYIEVGDQDMFYLDEGVEFLHRVLWDHRIPHEYRQVHGADHLGRTLGPRFVDGFRFLRDHVLAPWPPDTSPALQRGHAMTDAMKKAAGVSDSDPRPPLPPTDKPVRTEQGRD